MHFNARSFLREFVCDIVIFLYKIGESLLDATIRPYTITAVCRDIFDGVNDPGAGLDPWAVHKRALDTDHVSYGSSGYNSSETVCLRLHELPEIEAEVQRHAAGVLVAHRVLVNIPAVVLGLFCGAWSDTRGRKLPMMAPSVGSCLAVVLYLTSMQARDMKVALLLAGAATQGIFGKTALIAMAVNSHVSDTSDTDDRTRRLGRLLASNFLGMFLGSLLAGLLQDLSGLLTTLTVVSACHAVCVLTILVGVTETVGQDADEDDVSFVANKTGVKGAITSIKEEDEEGEEEEGEGGGGRKKRHALFSWAGLRDSLMAVGKKREGNKRSVIVISLVALTANACLKVGDQDITVLFVQQPPLSWPPSRYGYLVAADYGTMGLTLLFLLPLLSDTLRVSDITIVLLAIAFKLVRGLWAGFCTETWMMFASVVSGALGGLINPGLRSVLSKTGNSGEVGKLFSMQSSLETLSKLVGSSVFTGIYAVTVNAFPAAAYLSEAACYLAVLVLVLWLGQLVREDGAFGLLLTFARPYNALTRTGEATKPLPCTRSEEEEEGEGGKRETKTQDLFPLGASTP
ncbi:proton-coupled folate transporter-like [Littorina saxatilis]|uniref:Uncharacterized protein n=1 Tax=Littorina saxatilis TaxID=31220 RepID=A0AAN9AI15_9CAEN